jgi:hypothetical protein
MILGRKAECCSVEALAETARDGRSAVLVLRGEAGIGKPTLLEHAQNLATGLEVRRATGIEAEHRKPFADLHQFAAVRARCLDGEPLALLSRHARVSRRRRRRRGFRISNSGRSMRMMRALLESSFRTMFGATWRRSSCVSHAAIRWCPCGCWLA